MTELATRNGGTISVIQETALELAAAHRVATAICATSFAPQHFRGKPDEGAAAIMYGAPIGLDPLAALQNIYVIGGKPALYARTMVAVVMSKGHDIWTEEKTDTKVTVCGRRKGSEHVERESWTVDRAQKAGYTNNKKYQSDPQAMLYARASGDIARRLAPDALLGLAHNVEELELAGKTVDEPLRVPAVRSSALLAAAGVSSDNVATTPPEPPVKALSERDQAPASDEAEPPVSNGQEAIWPDVAPAGGLV